MTKPKTAKPIDNQSPLVKTPEDVRKPKFLKKVAFLRRISERTRTWFLRTIFSVFLISYFCFTIYTGPFLVMFTTLLIQIKCYFEIIDIGYASNKIPMLPWFRSISWYFLVTANYFCYGETLSGYFGAFTVTCPIMAFVIGYHRFNSFCLYFLGMLAFVLTLVRKYDLQQYSLLAWTHLTLLVIVTQSYMIVRSIFQGMIWLITSVTLVACNDIGAYICGSFFGRTPLIEVSPKKTWEGFIGAAFITVVYGFSFSHILSRYHFFVCPIKYIQNGASVRMTTECTPSYLFQPTDYNFFSLTLTTYPFVLRSVFFSLFSSIIAPFGGFFASGLKRAFHVKDFGSLIPGHGGILDRFDCQFLMATFVNVYISSFIREEGVENVYSRFLRMDVENQKEFFYLFKSSLESRNLLGNGTIVI